MPDATPQPRRRRWKRWTIIGLLVVTGGWCGLIVSDSSELRRAQNIQLGQTMPEVIAIMGEDSTLPFHGLPNPVLLVGRFQILRYKLAMQIRHLTAWSIPTPGMEDWPVVVYFDSSGRVDKFRRGREVIKDGDAR